MPRNLGSGLKKLSESGPNVTMVFLDKIYSTLYPRPPSECAPTTHQSSMVLSRIVLFF